jgi:hypothetical protein
VGIRERSERLRERSTRLAGQAGDVFRRHGAWLAYLLTAMLCTAYLNERANFIPKWGQFYDDGASEAQPYVYLQIRSWLHGHMALEPHPAGGINDTVWGRNGMHTPWGLGVPLLGLPFHLIGLLFGAPGFPERLRFLILFAGVTFALARALHATARDEAGALLASCAAAGFVIVNPTFIGLLCARFLIYDQTICTSALWNVLQIAGLLAVLHRCTPVRMALVCAAGAFTVLLRPPIAVYGLSTVVLVLFIGFRRGVKPLGFAGVIAATAAVVGLYFEGNVLRFGSAFNGGYSNLISNPMVNRLLRWGTSFKTVPWKNAFGEMYATAFRMDPVPGQTGNPPAAALPYVMGERWREYYSPGFDRIALAGFLIALVYVLWRVLRHRLWRRGVDLNAERAAIVGTWAMGPALVLFVFYARVGNLVSRYLVDMYPAMAAALLCTGMVIVDWFRARAPRYVGSAQLALAGCVALYNADWNGWPTGLSHPTERKQLIAKVAEIDAKSSVKPPPAPSHVKCNESHGPHIMHMDYDYWRGDCGYSSGMVFAMPQSHCVAFTFQPMSGNWGAGENESLASLQVTADFDELVSCGAPVVDGNARVVTMCDPRPPAFLLDGLRLYSFATLDKDYNPIDRLKLMAIDATTACK